jgi:hypothetical protein
VNSDPPIHNTRVKNDFMRLFLAELQRPRQSRSVLECGSPLPLFEPSYRAPFKSASRRRAEAALWRAAEAEGLGALHALADVRRLDARSCLTLTRHSLSLITKILQKPLAISR